MRTSAKLLIPLVLASCGTAAEAGGRRQRQAADSAHQLVAPNGVVTPTWATRRLENSPVPLYGYSWGRRPWAFPLAQQNTPSANMARWDQLGYGAGPIPGYTNGPPLGNYPTAPVGPTGTLPFQRSLSGNPFFGYPVNVYPTGIYLNGN